MIIYAVGQALAIGLIVIHDKMGGNLEINLAEIITLGIVISIYLTQNTDS